MLNKTPPNNLHSFLVRNHVICFLPTLSYNLSQFVCFTKTSDRNTEHRRLAHFGLQNHSNYSWRAAPWPDLTHIPQGSDRYVLRQGLPRTNPIAPIWPEHIWKWDVETPINPTRSGWGFLGWWKFMGTKLHVWHPQKGKSGFLLPSLSQPTSQKDRLKSLLESRNARKV